MTLTRRQVAEIVIENMPLNIWIPLSYIARSAHYNKGWIGNRSMANYLRGHKNLENKIVKRVSMWRRTEK